MEKMLDIQNRRDIKSLVDEFYDRVKTDDLIAHFFTKVVAVDWDKHLPIMYSFWENIVFHKGGYAGNPIAKHQELNSKCPMLSMHFKRWLQLFVATVDDMYAGDNAEIIKQRATSVATIMQIKIMKEQ